MLPVHLLLFCLETTVLFSVTSVYGRKQQCRLQPPRNQAVLQPPVNPGVGGDDTTTTTAPSSTGSIDIAGPIGTSATVTPSATPTPFRYGTDKIRGVNLGGWLVLEPWITPSVFESTARDAVVDEYTLGQLLNQQTAETILMRHWDTWISEDDFVQIKAAGLNHVRLPIGYWSIPITSADTSTSASPDPYVPGAWTYLLRALSWAKKHNINVILDLHGAPGSQNGYDNSGQRTANPVWALNPANVTRTIDTLRFLAKEVGDQVAVIELLNEAAGFRGNDWASVTREFWQDAYDAVREVAGDQVYIMIGDAFLGVNSWTNFLTPPRGHGVLMDFHEYQIFSDSELDRSMDDHINFACSYAQVLPAYSQNNLWTIIGEWSNAITDCARWLNGRGVGARWDGTYASTGPGSQAHGDCSHYTGSYRNWTQSYRDYLRRYWEVQVQVGEMAEGWVFWTWKAENADEWSYQKGLEGGWIPKDPANRKYPSICS
ncbi:hypothetical protein NLJ89_g179 [Agrocybe chaxingu]|uniref:Glycoside hydrolase family 5 domain-containing protein n=1 Tax=Agrocybe chaxingu TaxID=84603 RepID=A0A9W8TGB3_9AGAR|nr:hypothetical protein NLJ89_g179 [Agrocybe chaxingu]